MVVLATLPLSPSAEVIQHPVASAARTHRAPARDARDLALAPLPAADDEVLERVAIWCGAPPVRVEPRVLRADACAMWGCG